MGAPWSSVARLFAALDVGAGDLVVAPPGPGAGHWAGAPSALVDRDGTWWLAYRLRKPVDNGRGYANVIARSHDGTRFRAVATISSDQLGAASLERPALVQLPGGGWRIYVSCSTPGTKHWWVEALDAETPSELPHGRRSMVLPGDGTEAWKDVVVQHEGGWRMWACRHPLDGGDDAADRMSTWHATSADGLDWRLHGQCLGPGDGWDRRGARLSSVLTLADGTLAAFYDGRASAEENWCERTGLARGSAQRVASVAGPTPERVGAALRYVSVVSHESGLRAFFESSRRDGSHDLRTLLIR